MRLIKRYTATTGLALLIGALAVLCIGCGLNSDSDDQTQISINIARPPGSAGDSISSAIIDPASYPYLAALIRITAPDLPKPIIYDFNVEQIREKNGVLVILVPTGKARRVDVEVFEFNPTPVADTFPGRVWIPASSAEARTVDLTGTPTLINIELNPSGVVNLTGTIGDGRTGSPDVLYACANPSISMGFAYLFPAFQAGVIPLTLSLPASTYSVSGIPDVESFLVGVGDSATGAWAIKSLAPGMSTLNFYLVGASPLAISPASPSVSASASLQFSGVGGTGNYSYGFMSTPMSDPGASFDAGTGLYTAGSTWGVQDEVQVWDGCKGVSTLVTVTAPAACADDMDNDGDTLIDYPADPGCSSAGDDDELGTLECDDGIDNDGDTFTDYTGGDPECLSPAGTSESGSASISGTVVDWVGTGLANPSVYAEEASTGNPWYSGMGLANGTFTLEGIQPGTYYLSVYADGYKSEWWDSHDGMGTAMDPIVVSAGADSPIGYVTLNPTACNDGFDNDGWGDIDLEDLGCTDINDMDEYGTVQCDDGIDNDGDTFADKKDPGCEFGAADISEHSASVGQCDNGLDDDGDTLFDADDPSCYILTNNERDVTINLQCDDNEDNDGDTQTDFPLDGDCVSPFDYTEYADLDECAGSDTDGDGLIGGADPGCVASAGTEKDPSLPCDDGMDNDGDGLYDFNATFGGDPGCSAPDDPDGSENNAAGPACDDGIDNDGDTWIDFVPYWGGGDPGCSSVSDASELGTNECDDNIDNDGDTLTDYRWDVGADGQPGFAGVDDDNDTFLDNYTELGWAGSDDVYIGDPGCYAPSDSLETDYATQCDDGFDNDGDTQTDYPNDTNCSSVTCDDELMGLGCP